MQDRPFVPAWWLPGPHLPTLWGKLTRRVPHTGARSERWDTPDGDFLDLRRLDAPPGRPRLIVLHGLEGSPRSHYANGMFVQAKRLGWGADLLLFRSCGGELNRLARCYHSGETEDFDWALRRIAAEHPESPLVAAGFSLGGNVLLKWLGEKGEAASTLLRAAAAVSVPFDLSRSASHIDRGFSRVYQAHFIRSLRRKALAKAEQFPEFTRPDVIRGVRTFRDFDDVVTAPVHGFAGAEDYYTRASSIGFLRGIRIPTLLLSAVDDPFLPAEVLEDVRTIAAENPSVHVDFPARGGHVGFIGGAAPWRANYWGEWRTASFLATILQRGDAAAGTASDREARLGA